MCGINLAFGKSTIEKMNQILKHRGIRSSVCHLNKDLYLGHVRLPIQGLHESNDHPQFYQQWTGAFVGEIFNYKTIDEDAVSDLPVLLKEFADTSKTLLFIYWA